MTFLFADKLLYRRLRTVSWRYRYISDMLPSYIATINQLLFILTEEEENEIIGVRHIYFFLLQ